MNSINEKDKTLSTVLSIGIPLGLLSLAFYISSYGSISNTPFFE